MTGHGCGAISLASPATRAAALHLHEHSALAYVTALVGDTIETTRPIALLSSGEKCLWDALCVLAMDHDPFARTITHDAPQLLDSENLTAIDRAARIWMAVNANGQPVAQCSSCRQERHHMGSCAA